MSWRVIFLNKTNCVLVFTKWFPKLELLDTCILLFRTYVSTFSNAFMLVPVQAPKFLGLPVSTVAAAIATNSFAFC